MLYGGSRCVSGDTILNGQTKTIKELAELNNPVEVLTTYGKQIANPPFKKGKCQLIKIVTETNKTIEVTPDHKFWNGYKWIKAKDLNSSSLISVLKSKSFSNHLESNLVFYPSELLANVPSLKEIFLDYQDDYSDGPRRYGPRLRFLLISFLASYAFQSYEQVHSHLNIHHYLLLLNNQKDLFSLLELIYSLYDHKLPHLSMQDDSPYSCHASLSSNFFYGQIFELFQGRVQSDLKFLMQLSLPKSFELPFHNYVDQYVQFSLPYNIYSLDTPKKNSYKLERIKESTASTIQDYYTLNVPILEHYYANDFLNHNSGKTFLLVYAVLIRASKTKSRHIILRDKFNHAKRSLWLDTIPKVFEYALPNLYFKKNSSDYYIKLINGSEIWIGGLDSKERTEKILGNEYSTVYFNETSQIEYSSINLALTRLAEKTSLNKKVYYDSNPPKKSSWQYWVFEKKLDPIDNEPLKDPENYTSLLMNPNDNLENIDKDYISMLESLPKSERDRFLYGLYTDESDGQVYYAFNRETHVFDVKKQPGTVFIATDFNVDPYCSIAFQFIDNEIRIFNEFFLRNSDTFRATHAWKQAGYTGAIVIPDSTGKNRKTSGQSDFDIIRQAGFQIRSNHNPFVVDRVNNVNRLFGLNKIKISPKCKKLINDLDKVSWKNNKLDASDPMLTHISDALGYACHALLPFHGEIPRAYQL